MKTDVYERLLRLQLARRSVLKGTAGMGAAAALGALGSWPTRVLAQGDVRSQILQIPGVNMGSPTDADWQQVGALCLEPTKANVAEGEFAGVELTFMGLNNQNLHNFLFRGFLKPWEEYTGARISWIDLAQADYNARLQQSIATGTVDFDILEMGAPFEGDVCGKGLASEMPDWVAAQIEMDDYVGYLQAPVGTWDGKTYRISIDGDCHNFNYRTDYFADEELAKAWQAEGHEGEWGVPKTWQQVQEVTKFLKGKQVGGFDAYGYLDPLKGWGGFGFYFLGSRATAYAKHPDDPAWLFDVDTMKPRVNNPAWVRAIQDVLDVIDAQPPDQLNADPGTTGFQQFLAGTGSMLSWWGDIGSNAKTSDSSVIGDVCGFDILPGSDDVYNHGDRPVGHAAGRPQLRAQHGVHRLGRLRHGAGRQRSGQAEGGLERRRASRRQGPLALVRGLSVRLPALPQQPLQHPRMGRGRLRRGLHLELSRVPVQLLQSPQCRDRAAHPGHLPVLQRGRGRARQDLCRSVRRPDRRRQHRGRMGEDHRPDRP